MKDTARHACEQAKYPPCPKHRVGARYGAGLLCVRFAAARPIRRAAPPKPGSSRQHLDLRRLISSDAPASSTAAQAGSGISLLGSRSNHTSPQEASERDEVNAT